VFTELVQTDVMVLNKDGQFVDGLRREDFELLVDGQRRPIEFFERVTAGSATEEAQLAAARGAARGNKTDKGGPVPLDRGRTVLFYLDDVHLDSGGANLARKLVSQFVEKEMSQNDQVAITSASGQIGFLQQLTDNKTVLRAALQRFRPRSTSVKDMQFPPMSEYQALLVSRSDRDVTEYFIEVLMKEIPGLSREIADSMVKERAQQILMQAVNFTRITLSGLESMVRPMRELPGRKLVFLVSNGFFLDVRNSDTLDRLQRLASICAKNGVVIYTMDGRGLVSGLQDAATDSNFDNSGRLDRANQGELVASQDILNAIARDTGGRPVFNTNTLEPALKTALAETSTYYLLAWKPEAEQNSSTFRKIEVRLVAKKDLTVRVRRGFYDVDPPAPVSGIRKEKEQKEKSAESEMAEALSRRFPARAIPVTLTLSHVNTPDKGELLSSAMQLPSEFLSFRSEAGKRKSTVEIACLVYDDQGNAGGNFKQRLNVSVPNPVSGSDESNRSFQVTYNFPLFVKPGLYHVRVAARDPANGNTGSAHGWIQIPNVLSGDLSMSSVLLGERQSSSIENASAAIPDISDQINLSINRRFHRDSYLRFLVFVYNATRSADSAKPDAAVQVQLLRDDQPVVSTPLRKVESEGIADLARLPYAAEVPLTGLPTGHYLLRVTVVDRISKRSTSQQSRFEVF
jgi:VWFA-related protein